MTISAYQFIRIGGPFTHAELSAYSVKEKCHGLENITIQASEELSAQARQMKAIVDHLLVLVGGAGKGRNSRATMSSAGMKRKQPLHLIQGHGQPRDGNRKVLAGAEAQQARIHAGAQLHGHTATTDPQKVIPLNEDDFQDF